MTGLIRGFGSALRRRAEPIEALGGLTVLGIGVALTFSLGPALIVVGTIVFGVAVWPHLIRRR